MPELPEVESYRLAASLALGRKVAGVHAPDAWFLKRGLVADELDVLVGAELVDARRIGKLLLLDTDTGVTLGLRFGMTGRLVVDGVTPVSELIYSSSRDDPAWVRFGLDLTDGGSIHISDPRRLGGVELSPDESRLGPDALTASLAELRSALAGSATAVKARLMDQSRLAGVGNLIADEILWRAGIDPGRSAASIAPAESRVLHRALRATVRDLMRRGGSHQGELHQHRLPGGHCPRDGTELERRTIGGRTTWSCPAHQL